MHNVVSCDVPNHRVHIIRHLRHFDRLHDLRSVGEDVGPVNASIKTVVHYEGCWSRLVLIDGKISWQYAKLEGHLSFTIAHVVSPVSDLDWPRAVKPKQLVSVTALNEASNFTAILIINYDVESCFFGQVHKLSVKLR